MRACIASRGRSELQGLWKEAVAAPEVLFRHWPLGILNDLEGT